MPCLAMEKTPMHVQHRKPANPSYSTICRGSERSCYLGVILFFGLFSICLLIGLLVVNVQYNQVKSQQTRDLQGYKERLVSATVESKLLKNKLSRVQSLAKPNGDSNCDSNEELHNNLAERLSTCNETLFNLTKEREQLEEASSLESLSETDNLIACVPESEKLQFLSKERDQLITKLSQKTKELLRLCQMSENTTCPEGWQKKNCSCYQVSGLGSWDEGRADCISKGGDLVVINDEEEQNFFASLREDAWIGLSDRETEGSWKWVDGTSQNFTENSQLDEGSGDPETGEEDCAYITSNDSAPWKATSCNAFKQWICETIITVTPDCF